MKEPRWDILAYFPFEAISLVPQIAAYRKKLLVLAGLKAHNLILGKETPRTTLEVLLRKACVVYAVELLNDIAEVLEHATYNTVAT